MNKEQIIKWVKVVAIFIVSLIAIAANSCIFNCYSAGHIGGFYLVIGILNFFIEAMLIFLGVKFLFSKE